MRIISRIAAILFSYVLAYFLGSYIGALYAYVIPVSVTGSLSDAAANWLIGVPTALVIFAVFFLTSIGGRYKYVWLAVSLIPSIWFYLEFDLLHIYFPIILGLIAWGLGTIAHKTLQKFAPAFMSTIR